MEINVVVKNSSWTARDLELVFDGPDGVKEEIYLTSAEDIPNLMVELKCFPSKSAARRAGREGPIPRGFVKFKANKKSILWIWNPT